MTPTGSAATVHVHHVTPGGSMVNLKSLDSFVSKTILQQIPIELKHPIELWKCCFWLITDVFCHFLSAGASKTDFFMRNFNFWGDIVSKNMTQQTPCGPKHHIERQKCCFWSIISIFGHFLFVGASKTETFDFFMRKFCFWSDFVPKNMTEQTPCGPKHHIERQKCCFWSIISIFSHFFDICAFLI